MKVFALDLTDPNVNPVAHVSSINKIFSVFLNLALGVGAILFLFYALYSGFLWITAGGDTEKLKKARNNIMYSIFGLLLIFSSLLLTKIIGFVFKLQFPF